MADSIVVNGNGNVDALKPHTTASSHIATNGSVAHNAMGQSATASAELSNLAAARTHPPAYTAATGQRLTNYHSFFSELLSWRNPRASAIAYAATVTLIFVVRYLDVVRWSFKLTWIVLGLTIAAEVAGKVVLGNGLATQFRPRKYYTVPRENLDALLGDVHELTNFFVIESQRVLFAENVYVSAAAALAALISYYLVKVVPYWGLAVVATSIVFFAPLVYTTNQELIDSQLKNAGDMVNAQTAQLRSVAQKHTEQAAQVTKQYMGDYTAKAQALITGGHQSEKTPLKAVDLPAAPAAPAKAPAFPAVPKDDLKVADDQPKLVPESAAKSGEEPLIAT